MGAMTTGRIMCRQHLARGGAGGPRHLVRSLAGRVTFMPTAVPGLAAVMRDLRPARPLTRRPIGAGGAAVILPGVTRPARCRPARPRKAAWPGELALRRGASTSAAPTSWTRARTMMPDGTATPEAAAGGAACSAGAAAKPIQNLITTTQEPGSAGAGPLARRPRRGPECETGGRHRGRPRRRLAIQPHPAARFRGAVRIHAMVRLPPEAGFRAVLRFRPAVRFWAVGRFLPGVRFPPAVRARAVVRFRPAVRCRAVGSFPPGVRFPRAARARVASRCRVAVRARLVGRCQRAARSRPGRRAWTAT